MMTDSVAYTLTVVLSNDEFSTLQSFVDTNNGNMQDAHRVLVDMLKEVHLHPDYRPETWSSWLSDVVNIHLLTVLLVGIAVFLFKIFPYFRQIV